MPGASNRVSRAGQHRRGTVYTSPFSRAGKASGGNVRCGDSGDEGVSSLRAKLVPYGLLSSSFHITDASYSALGNTREGVGVGSSGVVGVSEKARIAGD